MSRDSQPKNGPANLMMLAELKGLKETIKTKDARIKELEQQVKDNKTSLEAGCRMINELSAQTPAGQSQAIVELKEEIQARESEITDLKAQLKKAEARPIVVRNAEKTGRVVEIKAKTTQVHAPVNANGVRSPDFKPFSEATRLAEEAAILPDGLLEKALADGVKEANAQRTINRQSLGGFGRRFK